MDKELVYKTATGEVATPFFNWVMEHGTAEEITVHNNGISHEFSLLLDKYFETQNIKTVTSYHNGEVIAADRPIVRHVTVPTAVDVPAVDVPE